MKKKLSSIQIGIILLLLLAIVFLGSLTLGQGNLSIQDVLNTLAGKGNSKQELIVFEFRLPRIIVSLLVGGGMSVSGAVLQGLTKNDLADPGLLGISQGAGFFVLLFLSFAPKSSYSTALFLPIAALIGSLIAAALIYKLSYKKNEVISSNRLVLTGVAVNTGITAGTLFLTLTLNREEFQFAQQWTTGSIWGDEWQYITILLPWVIILSGFVYYKSRTINVLSLGEQVAIGLGAHINKEFIVLSLAAVALAAGCTAIGGSIAFLGLIGPHMARRLVGDNYKYLLPITALIGGVLLLLADTIGRNILVGTEIPAGIVIAIIGAPYFLYLLIKAY